MNTLQIKSKGKLNRIKTLQQNSMGGYSGSQKNPKVPQVIPCRPGNDGIS